MTDLTLVILAAGMGSRYGGLKQLESVGPDGSAILDYSVFDAVRAGFNKVVLIIRPDLEEDVGRLLIPRFSPHVQVECAFQELSDLPAGFAVPSSRTKPWGTGHAVLASRDKVEGPFAVINADDFYGKESFATLAEFLRQPQPHDLPTYAMVGFSLRETLSEAGTVARGVCQRDEGGNLRSIREVLAIEKDGDTGRYTDENGAAQTLPGDTPVSMNLWGFQPLFLDQLSTGFSAFLEASQDNPKAEFYILDPVRHGIERGDFRVRVIPTGERWCGITHPDDRLRVQMHIASLIDNGVYPEQLWS